MSSISQLPLHDAPRHRFVLSYPEGEAVLEYELPAPVEAGAPGAAGAGSAARDAAKDAARNAAKDAAKVVFTHTFVPEALRGRGAAAVLVRAGLDWAAEQGLRVQASCSYVARYLEVHRIRQEN